MTGGHAGMSWRALRLAREEPGQVPRLHAFRAAHPEVIIIRWELSRPIDVISVAVWDRGPCQGG